MSNKYIISVIGGNGYVGRRCIQTLLKSFDNIKIYSIARSFELSELNKFDDRVEYIKGDALNPDSLSPIIEKSTGIIHTVGQLISDSDKNYQKVNYESVINIASLADKTNNLPTNKKNFVYISAERGLMFPLSLCFSGYINYKRMAEEKLIKDFKQINPIILRPGLIADLKDRPFLIPLSYTFDTINFLEKNVLNKISPSIGEKLDLPASSIYLDTLVFYAIAGSVGKLNMKIYSNDYMNNLENIRNINLNN